MKTSILMIFIVCVFPILGFTQVNPPEIFELNKEKFNMVLKYPENVPLKKDTAYKHLHIFHNISRTFEHYWETEHKDFLIFISAVDISVKGKSYAPFPNNTIFSLVSHLGNYQKNDWHTPYNNTRYFPNNKRELLNADVAGRCTFKLNEPFMDVYNYCVLQFVQKNDVVLVQTYFLFKELEIKVIEEILENNFEIVKFGTK